MVQITDLKNSAATLGKKELKQAADQILTILQDNYPGPRVRCQKGTIGNGAAFHKAGLPFQQNAFRMHQKYKHG